MRSRLCVHAASARAASVPRSCHDRSRFWLHGQESTLIADAWRRKVRATRPPAETTGRRGRACNECSAPHMHLYIRTRGKLPHRPRSPRRRRDPRARRGRQSRRHLGRRLAREDLTSHAGREPRSTRGARMAPTHIARREETRERMRWHVSCSASRSMTLHTGCARCNGTHCRCAGCRTAYARTSATCPAWSCRGAPLICRCGAVVADGASMAALSFSVRALALRSDYTRHVSV